MMPAIVTMKNTSPRFFRRIPSGLPGDLSVGECREKRIPSGFSLIEVVMALGIFAFVIIPVIGLVSGGMKNLRQSMDDTVRAGIAKEIAGEALRTPYSNVVTNISYYTDEGVTSSIAGAVFKATTTTNTQLTLVTTDTNVARMLTITVQHMQDTNNRTVFSQLLINSGQ